MNKQELIEKFEERKTIIGNFQGYAVWWEDVKEIFEQLDESKPVKVKQCVADWYEENKDNFEGNLFRCAHNIPSIFDGAKLNEFEKWFLNASTKPFQILVNMHQFGYEVEKEKRYLVKIKGIDPDFDILKYNLGARNWFTGSRREYSSFRLHHTRKELEDAGLGWVFDCPGIEIEEVAE